MKALPERRLLFLLGSVQFVNVLDFMLVMPLGPDFARDLGIPLSHLGWIGGSYTAAAALVGIVAARFLDRFDRRRVLTLAMLGLALGTLAGGFALGLGSLMAARVVAGAFGGPATSVALAIVADNVPPARRGRALGAVMGAFSVASVLGVPLGLELSRLGGFRLPFFAVAGLSVVVTLLVFALLPPQTAHLKADRRRKTARSLWALLRDGAVALSLTGSALAMFATFLLIPNLSSFFQNNLGYPREELGLLYFVGGVLSFAAMRLGGAWVDRSGPTVVNATGTALLALVLCLGFLRQPPLLPILVIFVGFMLANSLRNVAQSSLGSRVPEAQERAKFMSAQAAVQHLASSAGAIASSLLLTETPSGALAGIELLALLALGGAGVAPWLVAALSRRVVAREGRAPSVPPSSPPFSDAA